MDRSEALRQLETPLSRGMIIYAAVHLGALAAFFAPGPVLTGVAILAGSYFLRIFGLGAGYHRYFAHRSFKTSRAMQVVLALLGMTALQRGPLWWAETHRAHHRGADTPQDIHSPVYHGFWYSHWGWFFNPRHQKTHLEKVPDLACSPELVWLDSATATNIVVLLYVTGLCLLFGLQGFLWGFCLATVCTWHTTHWIQSFSHRYGGYRNFENRDSSRNHWLLGVVSLGEFHNNHHYRPSSARQGHHWWELDLTYWVLRLLAVFGLVWDVRNSLPGGDSAGPPPEVPEAEASSSEGERAWSERAAAER